MIDVFDDALMMVSISINLFDLPFFDLPFLDILEYLRVYLFPPVIATGLHLGMQKLIESSLRQI